MSISANINNAKTIRDYLSSTLESLTTEQQVTVTIKTGESSTATLTDVDLTWDGQNYYILGTETDTQANTKTTSIYKLDNVLPLTVTISPKPPQTT